MLRSNPPDGRDIRRPPSFSSSARSRPVDRTVKGAGRTLRQGTLIKSIRLTGDSQEIDCKYEGIEGLVLRAEFVRKR